MHDEDIQKALAEWAERFKGTNAGNCERQVHYRKQKKAEYASLRETIQELEAAKAKAIERRAALRAQDMLSWKEVAKALLDDRKLAQSQLNALAKDQAKHKRLVIEMYRWVSTQVLLQRSPNALCSTWHNVSLLASPESRTLGKEWITTQMFHNTDRVFQQYGFPSMASTEELELDIQFDFTETGYTLTMRRQFVNSLPFDDNIHYTKSTFLSTQTCIPQYDASLPLAIDEVEGNTMQQALVTPTNEYVNLLLGEFKPTPHSHRFVVQQIHDDERCSSELPPAPRTRNRMMWCDMERLPTGHTKVRCLAVISLTFAHGKPAPLAEEARVWGCDLDDCPEHLRQLRFPQLWMQQRALAVDRDRIAYMAARKAGLQVTHPAVN